MTRPAPTAAALEAPRSSPADRWISGVAAATVATPRRDRRRSQLQPHAAACPGPRPGRVARPCLPAVGRRYRARCLARPAGRPPPRVPVRLAALGRVRGRHGREPDLIPHTWHARTCDRRCPARPAQMAPPAGRTSQLTASPERSPAWPTPPACCRPPALPGTSCTATVTA